MTSLDEMLAMKKRFQPLMQTLSTGEEGQRIQTLLSLANMALTEQEQRFILGWLRRLHLDEEARDVWEYMILVMWLLGDMTEYHQAQRAFALLSEMLPLHLVERIRASFQ